MAAHDADPDPDEVHRRVLEAARNFLAAATMSEEDDAVGKRINETYLGRFLDNDPNRSETSKKCARKAQELIANFITTRATFTRRVRLATVGMEIVLQVSDVDLIAKLLRDVSASFSGTLSETRGQVEKDKAEAFRRVTDIGNLVIAVQSLATTSMLMRHVTLRTFLREKLDVGWSDIGKRVAEQLTEEAKEEAIQAAWDVACEIAAGMLLIVLEESSPLSKLPKVVKRIGKVVGVRKADTKPGGTDDMQRLFEQLEKENELLKQLDKTYELLGVALDEVVRLFGRPPEASTGIAT